MKRHAISYFSIFFFFIQEGEIGKGKKTPEKPIPGRLNVTALTSRHPNKSFFFNNGVVDFLKIKDKFVCTDKQEHGHVLRKYGYST